MAKILLLSVIIAMIVIPSRAAREPDPAKGLRKVVVQVIWFNLFYLFALMYIYPRLNG